MTDTHEYPDFQEDIFILEEIDLNDEFLITGFHGLGGIGYLTTRFIVDMALKQNLGKKIGYLLGPKIPPFIEVLDNGSFGFPYELFHVENSLFFLIRLQPLVEEQPIIAQKLSDFAIKNNLKGFILLGGIDRDIFKDNVPPAVYITNSYFRGYDSILSKLEIPPAPKGILVSGGLALLITYAEHKKIPAIALFAPTRKGILDKNGALKLAKVIISMLNLNISVQEIERDIKRTEMLLKEIREKVEKETKKEPISRSDTFQIFT